MNDPPGGALGKKHFLTTFTDLGLAEPLLRAVAAEGYTTPTPIQLQAIPYVLEGKDLMGLAQTGTGKTAAFALPILHRLILNKRRPPRFGCRVLVLAPTRELASQIAESFRVYGARLNLHIATVFGGVSHGPQIKALQRGIDVLVATPGRLCDHLDARAADLGGTEYLVLDEVDQMLDLGFFRSIRRIVGLLPVKRQNLFFSATMPDEIAGLAKELLTDPVRVAVTPVATTAERVDQKVFLIERARKRDLLAELFADPALNKAIVFTRTKHGADKVAQHLERAGVSACAIHGNKSQSQREKALATFRDGQARALVATDIAARGIDIDAVSHVINFELPEVPESYVHRIGRTARAGAGGIAYSLCDGEERALLRAIEKLTRQRIDTEDRSRPGAEEFSASAPSKLTKRRGGATGAPSQGRPSPERGRSAAHTSTGNGPDREARQTDRPGDARSGKPFRRRKPQRHGAQQAFGDNESLPRKTPRQARPARRPG